MRKIFIFLWLAFFALGLMQAQAFQDKEWLKYRVHYGFLNAGFTTLKVRGVNYNQLPHYHIVGKGSSSGVVRNLFKVDDRYETYMNKQTLLPSKFIRKIDEGGHIKDRVLTFDFNKKVVTINDRKKKKVNFKRISSNVQDMLSAFYYLRTLGNDKFKVGQVILVDVFMDGETFPFKLKVEKKETLKTKFGTTNAIKMKPYVQSGRVFQEEESVTLWVSDDQNLVPLKIKAELVVGSLEMDLEDYSNLVREPYFW